MHFGKLLSLYVYLFGCFLNARRHLVGFFCHASHVFVDILVTGQFFRRPLPELPALPTESPILFPLEEEGEEQ